MKNLFVAVVAICLFTASFPAWAADQNRPTPKQTNTSAPAPRAILLPNASPEIRNGFLRRVDGYCNTNGDCYGNICNTPTFSCNLGGIYRPIGASCTCLSAYGDNVPGHIGR
jgi:hypothetical protein